MQRLSNQRNKKAGYNQSKLSAGLKFNQIGWRAFQIIIIIIKKLFIAEQAIGGQAGVLAPGSRILKTATPPGTWPQSAAHTLHGPRGFSSRGQHGENDAAN